MNICKKTAVELIRKQKLFEDISFMVQRRLYMSSLQSRFSCMLGQSVIPKTKSKKKTMMVFGDSLLVGY